MSITIVHEVWRAIKSEIDEANLPDAAESLVDVLIQNDYEASDIKVHFRKESEVMEAVKAYIASQEEEEEDYADEDEDEDDDRW
jgi:hypothetical protein